MKGIGTDIVENDRIRKALNDSFMRKVLSPAEIEKSKDYKEERLVQFVAGRFAAKEAIIKCLRDYEVPILSELNITNNDKGKPEISYRNYQILLSISHERNYSVATAVLEGIDY